MSKLKGREKYVYCSPEQKNTAGKETTEFVGRVTQLSGITEVDLLNDSNACQASKA
jgi:hypothetical protein